MPHAQDFNLTSLLREAIAIAHDAGRVALRHRLAINATAKADGSPVTAADLECDALIRDRLSRISPFPILSEETAVSNSLRAATTFWVVDPLDGTKEFIKGTGEFTVNIALVDHTDSILGVVHAPVLDLTYYAISGSGAYKRVSGVDTRIHVVPPQDSVRVAISRDHVGDRERSLIDRLDAPITVRMGSSLKFCLVAEGAADLYPRFGTTMEWDTAAAQCVLHEAGGCVLGVDLQPLRYAKPGFVNPSFVAANDPSLIETVLADG